jgi:zinc protease
MIAFGARLTPDHSLVFHNLSMSLPELLDRTTPPAAQSVNAVSLLKPEVLPLPAGGRLHVLRNPALPVVQVQVVFAAGQWQQPAAAVATLTARALTEGTHQRTANQIAEYVARYGAFLENAAGADRATVTLYALRRHLPDLLPLLSEILTEATYPDGETQSAIQRFVQQARVEREKNAVRASERFSRNLFGAGHPYAAEIDLDTVSALEPSVLRAFYAANYHVGAAEIFVCGDVRDTEIAAILAMVSGLGTSLVSPPSVAAPFTVIQKDEIRLPSSMQSAVRMGRVWPTPHHPDTHRLFVLNKIFGGYFGSRLMKNIREDKGFTYGIYSSLTHREHASSFVIGADVNADSTEATFTEIYRELTRLREEPIPAEELETVRQFAVGKFVSETSTIFDQLSKYQYLVLRGLSTDHYDQMIDVIHTVTAEELQALAVAYLQPEQMLEVVVGRRD